MDIRYGIIFVLHSTPTAQKELNFFQCCTCKLKMKTDSRLCTSRVFYFTQKKQESTPRCPQYVDYM